MLNRTKLLLVFVFLLPGFTAFAQEDTLIKDIIEGLAERLPEDYDLSELTERLNFYRKHPVDLNHTSAEELKQLVVLSSLQISNLFNHLAVNGKLLDVLELQGIAGFDLATLSILLPFVTVKVASPLSDVQLKKLVLKGNHDLILRYGQLLEKQKGFGDLPGSRYLGTPEKLLLRYKYSYTDFISAAVVAEKDAGEYLVKGLTGADYLSANIALFKVGRIKKLVAGDYSLQFGQGLTLWSGFSFGKGADVTSVASKDVGLRPYSSTNGASFFRGAAATVTLGKHLDFTPFFSLRKVDASLKTDGDGNLTLQNISISGLHRTKTELKNKKSLGQQVYGAALQYVSNNLNVGFVGYRSEYEYRFVTGTQLYNRYGFEGKNLVNTGLHYNYTFKNVYFYGEVAHSLGSGWAIVNGAMASLSPKVSAVLLYRKYDRDYHNFFSSGVGEGTELSNEQGWYGGLNYIPNRRWAFSVYGDYFRFPWLKYRVDSASSGYEGLGQVAYTPSKTFKVLLRYKREVKQQNPDAGSKLKSLQTVEKQSGRIEFNWRLNKRFNFQQRLEVSGYQKGMSAGELGYLIFQDLNYHPMSSKLSGNMRIAYFNTPSYNSRIYAYEDDVLYGSSFGGYYDKGVRTFVNIRYRLLRHMDVWGRYAIYIYKGKETIGSGLDEIRGNIKSDVKFQIRYQF